MKSQTKKKANWAQVRERTALFQKEKSIIEPSSFNQVIDHIERKREREGGRKSEREIVREYRERQSQRDTKSDRERGSEGERKKESVRDRETAGEIEFEGDIERERAGEMERERKSAKWRQRERERDRD